VVEVFAGRTSMWSHTVHNLRLRSCDHHDDNGATDDDGGDDCDDGFSDHDEKEEEEEEEELFTSIWVEVMLDDTGDG